jgi:GntR family transcriptional regulator
MAPGNKRHSSTRHASAAEKPAAGRLEARELLQIQPGGVPIYVQIRDQVLRLIGRGVLKPGQQMWTMREVAVALRVDLNTVRHAYDELARTSAIEVIRARGTYVADKSARTAAAPETALVDEVAQRAIEMAAQAGVSAAAVARRILQFLQHRGDDK